MDLCQIGFASNIEDYLPRNWQSRRSTYSLETDGRSQIFHNSHTKYIEVCEPDRKLLELMGHTVKQLYYEYFIV